MEHFKSFMCDLLAGDSPEIAESIRLMVDISEVFASHICDDTVSGTEAWNEAQKILQLPHAPSAPMLIRSLAQSYETGIFGYSPMKVRKIQFISIALTIGAYPEEVRVDDGVEGRSWKLAPEQLAIEHLPVLPEEAPPEVETYLRERTLRMVESARADFPDAPLFMIWKELPSGDSYVGFVPEAAIHPL